MDIQPILDALRPFLSRLLAALIASGLSWLLSKGINLGPDAQGKLTEIALTLAMGIFAAIYAVVHRLLDKWLNPGDAAGTHLAAEEKFESNQLKSLANKRTGRRR